MPLSWIFEFLVCKENQQCSFLMLIIIDNYRPHNFRNGAVKGFKGNTTSIRGGINNHIIEESKSQRNVWSLVPETFRSYMLSSKIQG